MRSPRTILVLLSAGCASEAGDSAAPGWPADLSARLAAQERAFRPEPDKTLRARLPTGLEARLDETGLLARDPEGGELRLRFAAWGRGEDLAPVPEAAFALGGCGLEPERDAGGGCVRQAEARREGVTEWWRSLAGGLEQGWIVDAPPPGAGPLVLAIEAPGAAIDPVADGAWLTAPDGSAWLYGGLIAWDARGRLLPAGFQAAGEELRVVVDDAGAAWPVTIDPVLTTAGATLASPGDDAGFGFSVAGAGDVNDDGYADLVVGAPSYDEAAGWAAVYHGSPAGIEQDPAVVLASPGAGAYFGVSVAGAGDVNKDGYADVIVGAREHASADGWAAVYYGSAAGIAETGATALTGPGGAGYFGSAVAGAGDVNKDGYADVIVGAPGYSSARGRAQIHLGSASGAKAAAATTLSGPATSSYFGASVAGAGNVNGGLGYDDVIVGSPAYSVLTGRATIYHGNSSGVSTSAGTTIAGSALSYTGYAVAGAGDVDGDGYDDVIVGAHGYSSGVGRVTLHRGSSSGVSATATTTLTGPSASSYFGFALGGAGDVDGDGYDDVIVGTYAYDGDRGRADVYHGAAAGLEESPAATLEGLAAGDLFGLSVAGAGDVDGDTYADVAAGASGYDESRGQVTVYAGYPDDDDDAVDDRVDCDPADPLVGAPIAHYLDDDGDGYGDAAASETSCSPPGGYVADATDCDDGDASVNPGAGEIAGDEVDQDCDGTEVCYPDADADGHRGAGEIASADADCADAGEALAADPAGDCDDGDPAINPAAAEATGDEVDQDCDGSEACYVDADADGYRPDASSALASPDGDCADAGEAPGSAPVGDCDDGDSTVSPAAAEGVGDEIDQDCDGGELCRLDADGDGYRPDETSLLASADADCADAGEALSTDPINDCDDGDAGANPGAAEIAGDEVDQDCDGTEVCYTDGDADGYRPDETSLLASADADCADAGEALAADPAGDCDDGDPAINPDAPEGSGDEIDSNCDGKEVCPLDEDDDGHLPDGIAGFVIDLDLDCDDPGEGLATDPADDCDDADASIHPGASEIAGDEVDQDCDGGEVCHADADSDGYRPDGAATVGSADADCDDAGEALAAGPTGDCDDGDAGVNPDAAEIAGDEVDSDCDGAESCYLDGDDDGHRPDETSLLASADADCDDAGEALAADPADDCDDGDASVYGGASDPPGDGIDQDCDGGESCYADADDDGYRPDSAATVGSADADCDDSGEALSADPTGDCDDGDAGVNPGAGEIAGDEVDSDCDGAESCYLDGDDDGYRPDETSLLASADADCDDAGEALAGEPAGDCDDGDAGVNPGAGEIAGDEVDSDCDGAESCYLDADDDGYRPDGAATVGSADADCADAGEALAADPTGDCDDASGAFHPGAAEADCADPGDYNCDGSVGYADADGDGWAACQECDDGEAGVNPGAGEIAGDGADQDCDGGEVCYADADGDGYAVSDTVPSADLDCADGGEAAAPGGDCDDDAAAIYPGASEIAGDEVDQDCDGLELCYPDADGDGYRPDGEPSAGEDADCADAGEAPAGAPDGDCDDGDAGVNPGAGEIAGDGADQDCDGADAAAGGDDSGAVEEGGGEGGKRGCSAVSGGAGIGLALVGLLAGLGRRR